jgi:hypothetical protein
LDLVLRLPPLPQFNSSILALGAVKYNDRGLYSLQPPRKLRDSDSCNALFPKVSRPASILKSFPFPKISDRLDFPEMNVNFSYHTPANALAFIILAAH